MKDKLVAADVKEESAFKEVSQGLPAFLERQNHKEIFWYDKFPINIKKSPTVGTHLEYVDEMWIWKQL